MTDIIKNTFIEMDDALGQLSCAIDVIEVLTEGTVAGKATNPLHDQSRRLNELLKAAWPFAVQAPPDDDLLHEGATVFMDGKSYVLGRYWPEIKGWDLHHGGERELTLRRDVLMGSITGIKFKEAAA